MFHLQPSSSCLRRSTHFSAKCGLGPFFARRIQEDIQIASIDIVFMSSNPILNFRPKWKYILSADACIYVIYHIQIYSTTWTETAHHRRAGGKKTSGGSAKILHLLISWSLFIPLFDPNAQTALVLVLGTPTSALVWRCDWCVAPDLTMMKCLRLIEIAGLSLAASNSSLGGNVQECC